MMAEFWSIVMLAIAAAGSVVLADRDYLAAVYQHTPFGVGQGREPMEVWKTNLDIYEEQTNVAGTKKADIILFSEVGITGNFIELMRSREFVEPLSSECPDPELEDWIPCEEPDRHRAYPLVRLSCMAKRNHIYVVAGLITKHACAGKHDCPPDGRFSRNTAVGFDRNGKLTFRYFKTHLFFETINNSPKQPEIPIFHTDFGKLGVCICFDSVFKFPIVDLIQRAGIKNVLFPTYWVDLLEPAILWQQGFAAGNNVNFLASNAHSRVTTGGGIFSGKDVLASSHGRAELLLAKVPIAGPNQGDHGHVCRKCGCSGSDPAFKYKFPSEPKYTFHKPSQIAGKILKFTPLVSNEDTMTLCDNDLCCTLSYKFRSNPDNEMYVFGVASGLSVLNETRFKPDSKLKLQHKVAIQVCTLMKCPSNDRNSCGRFPTEAKATFEKFELSGNFSSHSLYPSLVTSDMTFPESDEWHHCTKCGRMWSKAGTRRPLVAAFFQGRPYERDELDPNQP